MENVESKVIIRCPNNIKPIKDECSDFGCALRSALSVILEGDMTRRQKEDNYPVVWKTYPKCPLRKILEKEFDIDTKITYVNNEPHDNINHSNGRKSKKYSS